MTLKIISAEQIVFDGQVSAVTLPGTMGSFTILHNHASLIATLDAGNIVYTDEADQQEHSRAIRGGIADIDRNVVTVCLS